MAKVNIGIDDMSLYIPKLYLSIEDLAKARNIEYEKLSLGLGLHKMAIPDVHEDPATMAANAVSEIIEKNNLDPRAIGRIYLGTESALDGSKPTATYLLEMLRRKYKDIYGVDCFTHCDVVDLTFACIGGVDALHNTLDWIRVNPDRIGIVVCADFAKYDLASTGEYTQGAGAVAMLVKKEPRLLVIPDRIGVATQGVHDFFKPKRKATKEQLVDEVLKLAGITHLTAADVLDKLPATLHVKGILDDNEDEIGISKETPIYDGPYSNWTYQNRIREAYQHFRTQAEEAGDLREQSAVIDAWARLIFHLPYAFHGKRVFPEIFMLEQKVNGKWEILAAQNMLVEPDRNEFESEAAYENAYAGFLKNVGKTGAYRSFISEKMEKAQRASSEIGNMYSCSIFLALISSLHYDMAANVDLAGQPIGFLSYGSGSKSKVFEGIIQEGWQEVVKGIRLMEKLDQRMQLDYATYEQIHTKKRTQSVVPPQGEFAIEKIGAEGTRLGARYYQWIASKVAVAY